MLRFRKYFVGRGLKKQQQEWWQHSLHCWPRLVTDDEAEETRQLAASRWSHLHNTLLLLAAQDDLILMSYICFLWNNKSYQLQSRTGVTWSQEDQWDPGQCCSSGNIFPVWRGYVYRRCIFSVLIYEVVFCASESCAGWSRQHQSSSGPHSWRTDPSSWCGAGSWDCRSWRCRPPRWG